ncbi:hypothetical protein [Hippea maritima]|uniref:Uncharacterized protein n=1 Tax=Hippea maritima (strain ATCC 700847 / DSM 10411 / MH2) TaxID=760142 RepID=F2LXI7_HIPMA|nr:hypothetical protein [Hippea maritima]AEA33173.1 hypothetical protein Hipma_0196 [Hippea maritima DSM 10411]
MNDLHRDFNRTSRVGIAQRLNKLPKISCYYRLKKTVKNGVFASVIQLS